MTTNNMNFTTTLQVNKSATDVFNTVMNVRSWWSGLYGEEFEGTSDKINDEFIFRAGEGMHYSRQKLVELEPNKRIVWLVTDSKLDFLNNKSEWTNTTISFDITEKDENTLVQFTHTGLVPEIECYSSCAPTWTKYIQQQLLHLLSS